MKISKEAKVGLLVVISCTILYTGFNFLKGKDYFSTSSTYYIKYNDIDGLTKSNSVMLNGFAIGRVDGIQLLHDKGDSLEVAISLDGSVELRSGTEAMLVDDGLLGGKKINLILGHGEGVIENKGYIPGVKEGSFTAALEAKAEPVIKNLEAMSSNLNEILADSTEDGMKNSIALFNKSLKKFGNTADQTSMLIAKNRSKITSAMTSVDSTMFLLKKTMKTLDPIMAKIDVLADSLNNADLKGVVAEAKLTMIAYKTLADDINAGKGTIGKIMKDEEMYNKLNMALQRLNLLLYNFDTDPEQYLAPLGQSQKKIMKKRLKNSKIESHYKEFEK